MNNLKRVRYFAGQLLTADDFVAEQQYFLEKHRRHNRYLHGYGVVYGLDISTDGVSTINVTPGMAIDCRGEEIAVCASVESRLPEAGDIVYITIRYVEKETDKVPAPGGPVSGDQDALQFTRIEEGFEIAFEPADPCAGHAREGSHRCSCGKPHGISLGKLNRTRGQWKLDGQFRRPAVPKS